MSLMQQIAELGNKVSILEKAEQKSQEEDNRLSELFGGIQGPLAVEDFHFSKAFCIYWSFNSVILYASKATFTAPGATFGDVRPKVDMAPRECHNITWHRQPGPKRRREIGQRVGKHDN